MASKAYLTAVFEMRANQFERACAQNGSDPVHVWANRWTLLDAMPEFLREAVWNFERATNRLEAEMA